MKRLTLIAFIFALLSGCIGGLAPSQDIVATYTTRDYEWCNIVSFEEPNAESNLEAVSRITLTSGSINPEAGGLTGEGPNGEIDITIRMDYQYPVEISSFFVNYSIVSETAGTLFITHSSVFGLETVISQTFAPNGTILNPDPPDLTRQTIYKNRDSVITTTNRIELRGYADNLSGAVYIHEIVIAGTGRNPFGTNDCYEIQNTPATTPTIPVYPTNTPQPTNTATITPSLTPTLTPTATNTPTATLTPSITPTITATPATTYIECDFSVSDCGFFAVGYDTADNLRTMGVYSPGTGAWTTTNSVTYPNGPYYDRALSIRKNFGVTYTIVSLYARYNYTAGTTAFCTAFWHATSTLQNSCSNGSDITLSWSGSLSTSYIGFRSWPYGLNNSNYNGSASVEYIRIGILTSSIPVPTATPTSSPTPTLTPSNTPNSATSTSIAQTSTAQGNATYWYQATQTTHTPTPVLTSTSTPTSTPFPNSTLISTPITISTLTSTPVPVVPTVPAGTATATATPDAPGNDYDPNGPNSSGGTCQDHTPTEPGNEGDGSWFEWFFDGFEVVVDCVIMPPVNFIKDIANETLSAVTDIFNFVKWGFESIVGWFDWFTTDFWQWLWQTVQNLLAQIQWAFSEFFKWIVDSLGQLYNTITGAIGQVSNAFTGAFGWIAFGLGQSQAVLDLWQNTPAVAPPGVPDCLDNPTDYDLCAMYYIANNTVFAGTAGGLILPLVAVYIGLAIVATFLDRIRLFVDKMKELMNE